MLLIGATSDLKRKKPISFSVSVLWFKLSACLGNTDRRISQFAFSTVENLFR